MRGPETVDWRQMKRSKAKQGRPSQDTDQLLTYPDAAKVLSISKSTLYALVSRGEIRVVRFGNGPKTKGCTRFRRADIEDFIESNLV